MGGRVVEGTGLENQQACKRLVGSNPTPSARTFIQAYAAAGSSTGPSSFFLFAINTGSGSIRAHSGMTDSTLASSDPARSSHASTPADMVAAIGLPPEFLDHGVKALCAPSLVLLQGLFATWTREQ